MSSFLAPPAVRLRSRNVNAKDTRIIVPRRQFLTFAMAGGAALALGCQRSTPGHSQPSAHPAQPPSPSGATSPAGSQPHASSGTYGSGSPRSASPAACEATAPNIEGPFFKAGSPERASLFDGRSRGQALRIRGRVLDTRCRVIAGARLEFWQANPQGAYDNQGFDLRGSQHSNDAGHYELRTVRPGRYLNGDRYRPAHIHVKVHAPGRPTLTTQLYFPDDPYNDGDPFIDRRLIMPVRTTQELVPGRYQRSYWQEASFDFIVG